jgi:hypothetical protein
LFRAEVAAAALIKNYYHDDDNAIEQSPSSEVDGNRQNKGPKPKPKPTTTTTTTTMTIGFVLSSLPTIRSPENVGTLSLWNRNDRNVQDVGSLRSLLRFHSFVSFSGKGSQRGEVA